MLLRIGNIKRYSASTSKLICFESSSSCDTFQVWPCREECRIPPLNGRLKISKQSRLCWSLKEIRPAQTARETSVSKVGCLCCIWNILRAEDYWPSAEPKIHGGRAGIWEYLSAYGKASIYRDGSIAHENQVLWHTSWNGHTHKQG